MNIDTMPAGREMDALIAEKVMGFKRHSHWNDDPMDCLSRDGVLMGWYRDDGTFTWHYWTKGCNFSEDIAAAWEVVEKMRRGFITITNRRGFTATINGFESDAETAPLAICRAALKAVAK